MIKFSNQVPSVYSSASRDFQYLGWLIDIVLNSVKHNVDDIYNLPNSKADPKLTELLAMTLGFKVKRNYDQNQLSALVAALPRILKYKGTKTAIDMAGNALIAASGASGDFSSEMSDTDSGELVVTFPVGLIDISLFTDLLDYILPAGMTCHIVRKNEENRTYVTELGYNEELIANFVQDLDWDEQAQNTTGLSTLFEIGAKKPIFANYVEDTDSKVKPNVGLLDNSIIPIMPRQEGPLTNQTSYIDYSTVLNDFDVANIPNIEENNTSITATTEENTK
jgi:hypothetical protein